MRGGNARTEREQWKVLLNYFHQQQRPSGESWVAGTGGEGLFSEATWKKPCKTPGSSRQQDRINWIK
ncbi:hypothetical protein INR49_031692 [Caranx melampygus]|nr:hypothetical protein INR49_031692 [Caranx melampygus]